MNNKLGRKYVRHYYEHTIEVVKLLIFDSGVREKMIETLNVIMPSIEDMMKGKKSVISKDQTSKIEDLINEVKRVGGPKLQKDIGQFEIDLRNGVLERSFLTPVSR